MKYKINKGFIIQKLDDKTVIFDGEESVIYTFNETASYIFKKIKEGVDEKTILKTMGKRYRIAIDRLEKDFKELIFDLRKKEIISFEKPTKQKKQPAD